MDLKNICLNIYDVNLFILGTKEEQLVMRLLTSGWYPGSISK